MPTFAVSRTFAPHLTDEDSELIQIRAIATAHLEPPFRWRRSFGFEGGGPPESLCVYEGPALRDLHWQQRFCWIPFDEIREVDEVCAPGAGSGLDVHRDGWPLYLVERHMEGLAGATALLGVNADANGRSGVEWIRSYWDKGRSVSKCLFAARSSASLAAGLSLDQRTTVRVSPVVEDHPSNWGPIFDRLGLPHYWEEPVAELS
jgi:hypothetical protein